MSVCPSSPTRTGQAADVAAAGGGLAAALGRVEQRDELAARGRRGSRGSRPASGAGASSRSTVLGLGERRAVRRRGASPGTGPPPTSTPSTSTTPAIACCSRTRTPTTSPAVAAQRLRSVGRRGRRSACGDGSRDELAQDHRAERDLPLLGLLPGLVEPVADPKRSTGRNGGSAPSGHAASGGSTSPTTRAVRWRKRTTASKVVAGVPRTRHSVWLAEASPPPRPAVGLGIEPAERPALAVLDRRPIGIEDVPLVQHGVGDGVHERSVHGATGSSAAASSRSRACSQVGMAAAAPVPVEPVEHVLAQAEPGAVRVIVIHQVAPGRRRQAEVASFSQGICATCRPPSAAS